MRSCSNSRISCYRGESRSLGRVATLLKALIQDFAATGGKTPADARLVFLADGTVEFHDGSADVAVFVPSTSHGPTYEPIRGIVLTTTHDGWAVRTKSGLTYRFSKPLTTQTYTLVHSLTDLCGNTVRFIRSNGELREIKDDTGHWIEVKSRTGRDSRDAVASSG